MRMRAVVVLVGLVIASLAFGDGAQAEPAPLDGPHLVAALLAPADVPGGGLATPSGAVIESEPHTQGNTATGGWCGGATDGSIADALHPSAGVIATLQKIAAPDQPYWFVWETLWSFEPSSGISAVAAAKSFMKSMKAAATGCPSWTTSGGEITNSVSGKIVKLAKVGDQRFAVLITTSGDGVSERTNAVYVRIANNVVVIHDRILPPNGALLKKIVKAAVKKLEQTAASA